jgi:hypothetical protein
MWYTVNLMRAAKSPQKVIGYAKGGEECHDIVVIWPLVVVERKRGGESWPSILSRI